MRESSERKFRMHVSSITFSSGQQVAIDGTELVLLVGPNNAGKSVALREIHRFATTAKSQRSIGKVVLDLEVVKTGSAQDLTHYLRECGARTVIDRGMEALYLNERIVTQEQLQSLIRPDAQDPVIGDNIAAIVGASERLNMIDGASIHFGQEPISTPLQRLHESEPLRTRLSRWFRLAFGTEIAVGIACGTQIPLYVGDGAEPREGEDPLHAGYRNRLFGLPTLAQQGDGMRSFVGQLLYVVLGHRLIYLVDEPEAFLHPPQARLLGRLLAEHKPEGAQVFVATHSADIVRGALEASSRSVRVLRITRSGDKNSVAELPPSSLQEVWADPVLRYSNALDGIFHERVVLCEAEGDCRFYAALADSLRLDPAHLYLRDVMFIAAGGKGGMAKLVRALTRLNVSVVVAADFDVLQHSGQIGALVEAYGASWSEYKVDHAMVKAAIDSLGTISSQEMHRNLNELAAGLEVNQKDVPSAVLSRLRDLLKPSKGWARAKSAGLTLLPKGETRAAGVRLLKRLSQISIEVVPCGEMEAFVPEETADKNEWVSTVLTRHASALQSAQELEEARAFVRRLICRPDAVGSIADALNLPSPPA